MVATLKKPELASSDSPPVRQDAGEDMRTVDEKAVDQLLDQLKKLDAREAKNKGELLKTWIARGRLLRRMKQAGPHGTWQKAVIKAGYNVRVCQRLMLISRSWLDEEIRIPNPLVLDNLPRSIDAVYVLAQADKDIALKVMGERKLGELKVAALRVLLPSKRSAQLTRRSTDAAGTAPSDEPPSAVPQQVPDEVTGETKSALSVPSTRKACEESTVESSATAQRAEEIDLVEQLLRDCKDIIAIVPKLAAIDRTQLDQRRHEIDEKLRSAGLALIDIKKWLGRQR